MRRVLAFVFLMMILGALLFAQTPAPQPAAGQRGPQAAQRGGGRGGRGGAAQRKVLLAWADTRNGVSQHAFTSHALAIVERLGYESGLWDTFIRTDSNIVSNTAFKTDGTPASGGPSLSNVDGIFFLGHREVDINAKQKEELLAFVRSGHGFVAAHTGLTAFESWPEFGEMLGAQYAGHAYTGPAKVINENPTFPMVKHLAATFDYTDEFYHAKTFSRDKIDVLLRLDPASVPNNPAIEKDGDYPLAWAKKYGNGRVFYGSFSHATELWDRRDIQLMYLEAIKWSLGLTDAEPAPHAIRNSSQQ
jgi:type 1 glutamine amidotransferase